MTNQEKFKRFCVAWVAYLVGSFALLKWVLVAQLGNVPVIVGVAVSLVAWAIGFLKWGPIHGNCDATKRRERA